MPQARRSRFLDGFTGRVAICRVHPVKEGVEQILRGCIAQLFPESTFSSSATLRISLAE